MKDLEQRPILTEDMTTDEMLDAMGDLTQIAIVPDDPNYIPDDLDDSIAKFFNLEKVVIKEGDLGSMSMDEYFRTHGGALILR